MSIQSNIINCGSNIGDKVQFVLSHKFVTKEIIWHVNVYDIVLCILQMVIFFINDLFRLLVPTYVRKSITW